MTESDTRNYVYLPISETELEVHVKLDDEGVAVDVWDLSKGEDGKVVDSTWKTYDEMGLTVDKITTEEDE